VNAPAITTVEFLSRLAIAAGLGFAIGFERQWRQRAAGLHTSSLVAVGAALFALLDTALGSGDTTRIVAGVVTGVGFIAGGVILRAGFNISGLNTAATIWATAAVGAMAGFGLWLFAVAGAFAIIVMNLLLQPIANAINVRAREEQGGDRVYKISIVCEPASQSSVSAAILEAISGSPLALKSLTRHHAESNFVRVQADLYAPEPEDGRIENLSKLLLSLTGVDRTDWQSSSP
jgi:putative Mg2+ transporter-C (MgtC) family protein